MQNSTMRFCLLHHTGWPGHADHYDLMLQAKLSDSDDDSVLNTWATIEDEVPSGDLEGTKFVQGVDHRKLYLRYEGPISGSRGFVKRIDDGTLQWLSNNVENNVQALEFNLYGRILLGSYIIKNKGCERFIMKKVHQFTK